MAVGVSENWEGVHCCSFLADADLSASVNQAVKLKEGGNLMEVDVMTGSDEFCHGVLVTADGTAAGEPVKVMTTPGRIVKMEAGAAIATVGDLLMTESGGTVIAHTGAVPSIGIALGVAGASGDLIPVFWWPERPENGIVAVPEAG